MPWYAWLFLILFLLSWIGFLLYFVFRKKPGVDTAKTELKLKEYEEELRLAKSRIAIEVLERQTAEKKKAEAEIALLEETHKDQLAKLEGKEKNDFEKAKADPTNGVDFIRDFLSD